MTSDSNPKTTCDHCGCEIESSLTGGLCPRCVLAKLLTDIVPDDHPSLKSISVNGKCPKLEDINEEIKGFEFIELIGRGGSGWTFLATQQSLSRAVAIKLMPRKESDPDESVERFRREAENLAKLNHPGIVTVHDFGASDNFLYIVMEFVEGETLRERMRFQKLTTPQALKVVTQICDAAEYAHHQGLMHRDIKPENILFVSDAPDAKIKVADFGISKLVDRKNAAEDLTHTGLIVGTPFYMAPEQNTVMSTIDKRADIYSIGVLLYEMLTGRLPMGRFNAPSFYGSSRKRLDQVVFKSLASEPAERYQTATELKRALAETSLAKSPPTWLIASTAAALVGLCIFFYFGGPRIIRLANNTRPEPTTHKEKQSPLQESTESSVDEKTEPKQNNDPAQNKPSPNPSRPGSNSVRNDSTALTPKTTPPPVDTSESKPSAVKNEQSAPDTIGSKSLDTQPVAETTQNSGSTDSASPKTNDDENPFVVLDPEVENANPFEISEDDSTESQDPENVLVSTAPKIKRRAVAPPQAPKDWKPAKDDKVMVKWGIKWYEGKVVEAKPGNLFRVHIDGWSEILDDDFDLEQLRPTTN